MNYANQFETMPEAAEAAPAEPSYGPQPETYSLKRMGQRPLTFEGSELCMAMSFSPSAPWWYEINMFRTASQSFVVAVKMFFQSEDERDICRAWECESFSDAMDKLEGYDAANDVRLDIAPDDPGLSLPELAAHALALRAKATEARRQYNSLVGEVLHDLAKG